jgi:cobyrinic acid a,c-diamide synthase
MLKFPRLVLAGIRGGSGKTTLSLSLITALRALKGLRVIPFKKGPDYIDAGWLSLAAQAPCYNLDPFLIPREKVVRSFYDRSRGDIAVIEGNRGLFDGVDAEGSFSTAELAKLLNAPVILVIDCTKMTRTTAAVVLGCMQLDRDVRIRGVVLNQLAGKRHELIARESVEKYCHIPVLGAIPRLESEELPERHMGLTPIQEYPERDRVIAGMEAIAGKYLDLDAFIAIAREADDFPLPATGAADEADATPGEPVRVGVIRDAAFQFYYPENLEALQEQGAVLVEIDAATEPRLPDLDALYIGGGFPETNAPALARNESFRRSVHDAAEAGLPVYAECGGLMFLGESLAMNGTIYPMVGIFPLAFDMRKKPQAHGYTVAEADRGNPFYPVGTVLHGHEFHYSSVLSLGGRDGMYLAFSMRRGKGIRDGRDGLCYKNVLATYTHIHALGSPGWARGFLAKAREVKETYEKKRSA